MSTFAYTLFHNIQVDAEGHRGKGLSYGYDHGDRLVLGYSGSVESKHDVWDNVAEAVFALHNQDNRPDGPRDLPFAAPSLSKGDVVCLVTGFDDGTGWEADLTRLQRRYYSVEALGFEEIPEPENVEVEKTYKEAIAQ